MHKLLLNMQELVHQNHFVVYPNIFMVFKYLCNRANIRANQVFVSALLIIMILAIATTCDTLALQYSGVNLKYPGNWKPFKFLCLTTPLVANRL